MNIINTHSFFHKQEYSNQTKGKVIRFGHWLISKLEMIPFLGKLIAKIEEATRSVFKLSQIINPTTINIQQSRLLANKKIVPIIPVKTKPIPSPTNPKSEPKRANEVETTSQKIYKTINDHSKEILPLFQNALLDRKDPKVQLQIKQFYGIFQGADFLVRHGAMHVSHVALMVPIMVNFYKSCGDTRAQNISTKELEALQIAAFFHDYGRSVKKSDLTSDSHEMEEIGANACFEYLICHGFEKELGEKMRLAMIEKDEIKPTSPDFKDKDIFSEMIQNCDCLGVQRADDWSFNPKYLGATYRIDHWDVKNKGQNKENLYEIIDETKLHLVSLWDSPLDFMPLSKKYKAEGMIKGKFSVEEKRKIETSSDCFALMEKELLKFPALQRWY